MSDNFRLLESIRIVSDDWEFFDMRIKIPPLSLGSDAANPHTNYSNAVARFNFDNIEGIGACFTLGEGNQVICAAAEYIVRKLDGLLVKDLLDSNQGFAETLINPLQLRWLSPNSGVPMMAAGLVLNTLLDLVSKIAGLPAWEYLASLESGEFLKLVTVRHLIESEQVVNYWNNNQPNAVELAERIEELKTTGVPAYFTTWIGSSSDSIAQEMKSVYEEKGINIFKIKIGNDFNAEKAKIVNILEKSPSHFRFAADANQRLTYSDAQNWMKFLSEHNFLWLEEPFAPDNHLLFKNLSVDKRENGWNCEIATGENCPNLHTAQALLISGINRFQSDPCRMMGLADGSFSGILSKMYNAEFTPHSGGAGLDEMSPHLQYFFLAKVNFRKKIETSLTEIIGFCSKLYLSPTEIFEGRILPPKTPGLLVGFSPNVTKHFVPHREGISWLEL